MTNLSISQNFLVSESLVKELVSYIDFNTNDEVLEIGPGKGIITKELIKHSLVTAIEYDSSLYNDLLKMNISNLNLINDDFLNYTFSKNTIIISNIPFNITSNIFNKILENYVYIDDFYFIMQKEPALMYLGENNESMKSLLIKPLYEGKILYEFKKSDFNPSPSVDTVFIHFHKKEYIDIKRSTVEEYYDFIANIFSNNETTIKGNVKEVLTYEQLKRIKKLLKCSFDDRITNLHYQDFITLYNTYRDYTPQIKKDLIKGSYRKLKNKQEKLQKINRTR